MEASNITPHFTKFPITSCHTFDLPEDKGYDCSIYNETDCIRCPIRSRFMMGDRLEDYGSAGHIICIILCIMTFIVGSCGALGNFLIIIVLKRQKRAMAFDKLLVGLAGIDLLCSVVSAIASIMAVVIFQNWSKGVVTLCLFWQCTLTSLFSRSGSSFMTVVITIERYLVVAHPLKTINLFSIKRTRFIVLGVLIFAFLMAFPRYSSMFIGENKFKREIESVKDLEYIITGTKLTKFWYVDMKGFFDQIDFWTPLPLLLIFNALIYYHILKFKSRRADMNMKHKKNIRAAQMFLPVVIILFLCNIIPIIHYYFVYNKVVYKELLLGIFFSYVVNSAVNLPIYYSRGSSFRKETRVVLATHMPFLARYFKGAENTNSKGIGGTGTTNDSKSNDDNSDTLNMN